MSVASLFRNNYYGLKCENLEVAGLSSFNGSFAITGNMDIGGHINTNSTEIDSIKTLGGADIAGDVKCANATITNALTCQTIEYSQKEIIESTDDCTGLNTGASQVRGGESVDKTLYVGTGIHSIKTTNSTSKNDQDASVVISGGVSVNLDVQANNIHGSIVTDSITSPSNNLHINSTSSTATGNISAATFSTTGGVQSLDYTHGDIVALGGIATSNNVQSFGDVISQGQLKGKSLNVVNTINKISTDGGMTENSDLNLPTEKAIVSYVSTHGGSSAGGLPYQLQYASLTNTLEGCLRYSVDNSDNAISKLILTSPNNVKKLNLSIEQFNNKGKIENTTDNLEFWTKGIKCATLKPDGIIQLDRGVSNSTITLDTNNTINFENTKFNQTPQSNGLTLFKPLVAYQASLNINASDGKLDVTCNNNDINLNTPLGKVTTSTNFQSTGSMTGSDVITSTIPSLNSWYTSMNKINGSVLSLKNYATGDGVTDDTVGVQAWFNALTASGGSPGIGLIPKGTYLCSSTITFNLTNVATTPPRIIGEGMNVSVISINGGQFLITSASLTEYLTMSDFKITCFVNDYAFRMNAMLRDAEFRRMIITNTNAGLSSSVMYQYYIVDSVFEAVSLIGTGYRGTGLYMNNSTNLKMTGGYISGVSVGLSLNNICTSNVFEIPNIEWVTTCVYISNGTNNIFIGGLFYEFTTCINAIGGGGNVFMQPSFGGIGTKYLNTVGIGVYHNTYPIGTIVMPNNLYTSGIFFGSSPVALTTYEYNLASLTWSQGLANSFAVSCERVGRSVTISSPRFTGTSSASGTTFLLSATGIPLTFRPATVVYQPIWTLNNTTNNTGLLIIGTDGIITIYRDISNLGTNFQNNTTIGYSLQLTYCV